MKTYDKKEFDFYLNNHDKWAMIFEVTFKNIRLKEPDATPVPYISSSKCSTLVFNMPKQNTSKAKRKYKKAKQVDNGRVMQSELLTTIVTETDFLIIMEQYSWQEIRFGKIKVAKKKPIPKELKKKILEFYFNKTALKQDEDDPNYDEDKAYNCARAKEMVNGIYGMHCTNPCRSDFEFDERSHLIIESKRDDEELLEEYYNSFSSFLSYQVGIWCTSYARLWLEEGIRACRREVTLEDGTKKIVNDLIYCDTDSCKFLNPSLHEAAFKEINDRRIALAEKKGAYVDFNGKRYHLGIYTDEPKALAFKTFGAKKYMYSYMVKDKDTKELKETYKITISGVPKKKGKACIDEAIKKGKLKSPFDLSKGFVFRGIKTTSCYMDHDKIHEFEVEGKKVYFASNVAMYPSSYTLGLTYEFELMLEKYKDYMEV